MSTRLTWTWGIKGFLAMSVGFPNGSDSKESACNAGDPGSIPGRGDPLEKRMTIHSSILAWRIPWTEELVAYFPCGYKDSEATERLTLLLSILLGLFRTIHWLDDAFPLWWGWIFFTQAADLVCSRNAILDTPRNNALPDVGACLRPVKLAHEINHHST